jgi:multidrug efflux pump subunit AcrA (membrane-fusion protein)
MAPGTATRPLPAAGKKKPVTRWYPWAMAIGLGVALVGAVVFFMPKRSAASRADLVPFTVRRDTLVVSITERGALEAAENKDVICHVKAGKGSTIATTIRAVLVDDGSHVKTGDQLIHLDDSGLIEQLKAQKIVRDKAKNEWNNAVQTFEITKRQNEKEVESAKVAVELAQIDLRKYKEGDLPQLSAEIKGRVLVAESDLEIWKDREVWNDRMVSKNYRTGNQAMADRFKQQSAELSLKKVREELRVLENFTAPRTMKELESKLIEAKSAFRTAQIQAEAKKIQALGDMETKELVFKQEQRRCDDLDEEIRNCLITAPQDGLVVYYVPEQSRFGSGSQQSIIAQGEPVREGQKLMRIPNLNRMLVNVRVHEAMRARVRGDVSFGLNEFHALSELALRNRFGRFVFESAFNLSRDELVDFHPILIKGGLRAEIRIDAFPNKVLKGHVRTVDEVPAATDFWTSDITVYRTMVSIDEALQNSKGEDIKLKPGMKAAVTIYTEDRADNAILIPLQAVQGSARDGFFCQVLTPEGTEKRPIVPGLSNDRMVEVREGLSEDEQVLLTGKDRGRVAEQGGSEKGGKGKGKGGSPSGGTEGGPRGGPPGGKGKPG